MSNDLRQTIEQTLIKIPLFSEYSEEELYEVSSFTVLKEYKKHQFIFMEGEPYSGFYIVTRGKIKVFRLSSEGKEAIVHLSQPYDPFAEVALFEGMTVYPVNAQALEQSSLIFISKEGFLTFLNSHPQVNFKMIAGFTKKLRELTARFEAVTLSEVSSRLAGYICKELEKNRLSGYTGSNVRITITKSDLAAFLGTAVETLSRTFKKMQEEGIILVKGPLIRVRNFSRLKEIAS